MASFEARYGADDHNGGAFGGCGAFLEVRDGGFDQSEEAKDIGFETFLPCFGSGVDDIGASFGGVVLVW